MADTLKLITEQYSKIYFIRQFLTILALICYGFILIVPLNYRKNRKRPFSPFWMVLLSFPMGLSVFISTGLMLFISIKVYVRLSIIEIMFVVIVAAICFSEANYNEFINDFNLKNVNGILKGFLFIIVIAVVVAISTSGILPIIYSNDSMYYYNAYPKEIVFAQTLSSRMDTFLTDSGQGTAIINTLQYLFGFNESFGIQHFFNINFILIYFYALYECLERRFKKIGEKTFGNVKINYKALIYALIFTLLLITSMPFVILSKWAIANVYFMEIGFICVYLAYKMKKDKMENMFILAPLLFMFSTMRIEAAIFCGFILMCFIYAGFKKTEILWITLPIMIVHSMYYYRIFWYLYLKSTYTFMTKEKAIIAIAFLASIIIYAYLMDAVNKRIKKGINNNFVKLIAYTFTNPLIITMLALIFVNFGLFVYDHNLYIVNIKSFIKNTLNQSGWGFFVAVIIVFILLIPKKKISTNYFDFVYIGFVLMVIALCFARGGDLRESFADSGNRVLLQVVPFVLFAFSFRFIETIDNINIKKK